MKWQEKAADIRAGKQKSMLTILEERGLVHTVTGYAILPVHTSHSDDIPGVARLPTKG
jgi:hypothetical protein